MTSTPPSRHNTSIATKPEQQHLPLQICSHNLDKMKPIVQSISRTPHVWKRQSSCPDFTNPCTVVPSALLFEETKSGTPFDLTQVTLESHLDRECEEDLSSSSLSFDLEDISSHSRSSVSKISTVTFHHKHILRYKGEKVCVFETRHYANARGTWGQSMTVRQQGRVRGDIQARILHKGRTSTGNGWNAHERRTYRVMDILEEAAERYADHQ